MKIAYFWDEQQQLFVFIATWKFLSHSFEILGDSFLLLGEFFTLLTFIIWVNIIDDEFFEWLTFHRELLMEVFTIANLWQVANRIFLFKEHDIRHCWIKCSFDKHNTIPYYSLTSLFIFWFWRKMIHSECLFNSL